jgi:hypothetical protein
MHLLYSHHPWSLRYGPDPTINFCCWILLLDGLRVPPFDQHSTGDGSLQELGLTEASWQAWFLRVLDPHQRKQDEEQLRQQWLAEYLKMSGEPDLEHLSRRYQAERLKQSNDPPLPPEPEVYSYHASWRGNSAIRNRLIELEQRYKQVYRDYDVLCSDILRALGKEERRSEINLYDALKPYHTRIPPLAVHFVGYEHPLDYLVPPATLIMTVQEGQPNPQDFRERILAAAAELSAQPVQRRRPSAYTRIGGGSTNQSIAYRRHVRAPASPPLPQPEIPRLDDPFRQIVAEELGSEFVCDGIVDLTTLQFLREKQRPGWKLYEVTFQETDGEQHRMIVILQQNDDGSWSWNGGGTSADMQNQWSKVYAPVRDHPLLFLVPQGFIIDNQQYLQLAHGDVIDNGFQVERVRLVNGMGQVLEDVVEDGYVFFACKLEELVRLPMQAELYDRQSKLVWQQTVTIGDGLPS